MSQHFVERARDSPEIERLDEETRIADLPPAAAAHEAAELVLDRSALPRSLFLERAKGGEVAFSFRDLLHRIRPDGADQLVFEIGEAHEETQLLHLARRKPRAECRLEAAPKVPFLAGVAKSREPDAESVRAVPVQEPSDRLRTADRDDPDAFRCKISPTAPRERFDGDLIADSLDEDDRTEIDM